MFKIQTPKRSTTLRLAGPFFVLGRGEPYRIFQEDPTLSREHLAVVTTQDGYLVKDLGSRNGVFLNGKRLDRYAEKPLSLGDVLVAGNTKVQLVLQQEADVKDSVTVDADGRTTALEESAEASPEEDLEGEVTGELDRPELLEDEDEGDPEETQIALDDEDLDDEDLDAEELDAEDLDAEELDAEDLDAEEPDAEEPPKILEE